MIPTSVISAIAQLCLVTSTSWMDSRRQSAECQIRMVKCVESKLKSNSFLASNDVLVKCVLEGGVLK